jgi:hypothetical protein
LEYETVRVTTGIDSLSIWAKNHGVTYAQLKDANIWLRGKELINKTGKEYIIKIPKAESIKYDRREIKPHSKSWCKMY